MTTIQIQGSGRVAVSNARDRTHVRTRRCCTGSFSVLLIGVVPDALHADLRLVPAVGRHCREADLERQQGKQKNG